LSTLQSPYLHDNSQTLISLLFASNRVRTKQTNMNKTRINLFQISARMVSRILADLLKSKLFTRVYSRSLARPGLRRRRAVLIDRGRDRLSCRIWRARRRFQG